MINWNFFVLAIENKVCSLTISSRIARKSICNEEYYLSKYNYGKLWFWYMFSKKPKILITHLSTLNSVFIPEKGKSQSSDTLLKRLLVS